MLLQVHSVHLRHHHHRVHLRFHCFCNDLISFLGDFEDYLPCHCHYCQQIHWNLKTNLGHLHLFWIQKPSKVFFNLFSFLLVDNNCFPTVEVASSWMLRPSLLNLKGCYQVGIELSLVLIMPTMPEYVVDGFGLQTSYYYLNSTHGMLPLLVMGQRG